MANTWDILQKETAHYGIKLVDQENCRFKYKSKIYNAPIKTKIKLIDKQIKENNNLLNNLFSELSDLLNFKPEMEASCAVDVKIVNLFINSLKEIDTLARLLCSACPDTRKELIKNGFFKHLQSALNTDYIDFPKDVICCVPDYKLCIDWVIRKNSSLSYVEKLLLFVLSGQVFTNKGVVKTARGISGPWANLDLPMLERVFEWEDIADEVKGRQKDKQHQRRYRKGFENYNNDGRVGEGFYFRELRNEPFSWYNRSTEDPYPQRHLMSRP